MLQCSVSIRVDTVDPDVVETVEPAEVDDIVGEDDVAVLSVDSVDTVGADAVETVDPAEVDDIVGEDDVAVLSVDSSRYSRTRCS